MPLTKRDLEAMSEKGVIWDAGKGAVTGFGARFQGRAKVFVLKYAFGGRARWYSIGRFGAPWTVENARAEARRLTGLVASGIDPQAEKLTPPPIVHAILTVAEVCDRYMEAANAGLILTRFNRPKRATTLEIDKGRIKRHIKPLIGSVAIKEIDQAVIRRMINDITVGKTKDDERTGSRGRAIVRGGAGTAARVADLMSGIMAWAVEEQMIAANPVHGVKRYRGEARDRYLSEQELERLGGVLRAGVDAKGGPIHPYALKIIELLALTGCRAGEITNLRWNEFDEKDSCLRLDETKTGKSMRAIGSIPRQILAAWPRLAGNPFVFPATRGEGESAYQGTKREVRKIMQAAAIDDAGCHTLRHTFGSVASDLGYSDATIAGLLGHKGRGITSRYVHRPDSALIAAADAVASRIAGLAGHAPPVAD